MWRLELKLYDEQQKITRTTKSISYNMTNTVRSLTRITPSTESLIDVIVT